MSREASLELAERLSKDAGFKAKSYSRSPVAGAGFIINTDRGKLIRTWLKEQTETEIFTNKRHKQAVLNIYENSRILKQNRLFNVDNCLRDLCITKKSDLEELKNTNSALYSRFKSVVERNGLRYNSITAPVANCKRSTSLIKESLEDIKYSNTLNRYIGYVMVRHKLEIPESEITLLTGIDETAHFICALPEKAKSVAHAHDILKPKSLKNKDKVLRQGEFFFEPCSDKLSKQIFKYLSRHPNSVEANGSLEDNSSHHASLLLNYNRNLYAFGTIFDKRETRHKPLFFNKWYKVVRNREIPVPLNNRQTRYWD